MSDSPVAIIVHGGAKEIAPEKAQANRDGCRRAAEAGWAVLSAGGPATEAVVAAVRVLEADPTFNAGIGATPNPDGVVRLDAGIMEGDGLEAGAVACLEGVRHPITIARRLLERTEVLLVAEHARRYAAEACPDELCDNAELKPDEGQAGKDTVGAVALDARGLIAAGTSTGGLGTSLIGRVGDSPQVGAGFYADNAMGGCSCTGEGEAILRLALSRSVLGKLQDGRHPDAVIREELDRLARRTRGAAGVIVLAPGGRVGWGHNEPNMAVAYRTSRMGAVAAFAHKDEELHGGGNKGMPENDDEMMTSDGDTGAGFGAVATGESTNAAGGEVDRDEGEVDVPGAPPPDHDPARGGSLGTTVGEVLETGGLDTGGAGVPVGSTAGHGVDRRFGEPQGS